MKPLPDAARLFVPPSLAADLAAAAGALPARANESYFDDAFQLEALNGVRDACSDGFAWLVGEINTRMTCAPYAANISGLRFDAENRLFIALNRAFGRLVCKPLQKPRAQLVQYIHHQADLVDPETGRARTEMLHTDGADWPEMIDIISMVCVQKDENNEGLSRLIARETVREVVHDAYGDAVVAVLENEPVPWLSAPAFNSRIVWRPVFANAQLCWRRYTIDAALDHSGIVLPKHVSRALDAMDAVVASTGQAHRWLMQNGDFLMMDNRQALHSRTAVTARTSGRVMMRSWIRRADGVADTQSGSTGSGA